ncbi:glial fibrillary acidic protein [Trichomycterus rosablanca]|uniref:glial fibrillary acidic protein n=1 Tax=Trichomycterus rosablanca TaxID=2290929 RepID=UPI002F357551
MAMLRVSSYRRLLEQKQQRPATWFSQRCGTQILPSATRGGVSMIECPEPDFAAARALNREAVRRFAQERSMMVGLNDRLAVLIDMERCLEEENESLEAQIIEMEKRLAAKPSSFTALGRGFPSDSSLEAVVEKLRREKEEILCDINNLKKDLQHKQKKYDEAVEQRTLLQLEREDVAVEVDAVTADCLALREQVAVYEAQLAEMEQQHELRIESLSEAAAEDKHVSTVSLKFPCIDMNPAITVIKEYYCQLAESLQFDSAVAAVSRRDVIGRPGEKTSRGKVKADSEVMDVKALKELIAELRRELAEKEKCKEELETEIQSKSEDHLLEIEELETCICRLEEEEADLQAQMKEQIADHDELLNEKMALDIEIAAYRTLVEKEEDRICNL